MFAYVVVRDRDLPTLGLLAVVFVGSQFPDLVDKPLANQFALIPSGRVFMHSLPFAVPIALAVAVYGWNTGRLRAGTAFGFAYLSHLLADNYRALLAPDPSVPPDLLWPFLPAVTRSAVPHWAGPDGINVTLWTLFSAVVLASLAYALVADLREQVDA
nr:metal-dependent hydrolase [Halomicroarcula sp. XH51]